MKKIFAIAALFALFALLAVSVACNLYQKALLKDLAAELANGKRSENGSTAVTHPASEASLPVAPMIPFAPSPEADTEAVKKPQLIYRWSNSTQCFDENGIPFCDSISLRLANLDAGNPKDVIDGISIVPKPARLDDVSIGSNMLELKGVFEPGTEHVISLPVGTMTKYGKTEHLSTFVIRTGGDAPCLGFTEVGRFYPVGTGGKRKCTLAVEAFGIDKANVTIERVPRENMDVAGVISSIRYRETAEDVMISVAEKTYDIPSCMKRRQRMLLDIGDMLKELKAGIYKIRLSPSASSNYDSLPYYINGNNELEMVLSDLGISATASPYAKSIAVFVRSLETQKAVEKCRVRAYTRNRVLLAEGLTAEDGTALLDYSSIDEKKAAGSMFIVAEKDGDVTSLSLNDASELSNAEFNNVGRSFSEMKAFIYTERGIYRPGELVEASVFVRRQTKDGFAGCALRCEMRLADPEGRIVGRKLIDTNEDGFGRASFQLDNSARGAIYVLECGIPGEREWDFHEIYVGSFTPDRIKLQLTAKQEVLHENQVAELKVNGRYYFGKELEGGVLKMSVFQVEQHFPPHWKDYSVGRVSHDTATVDLGTIWEKQYVHLNDEVFYVPNIRRALVNSHGRTDVPVRLRAMASASEKGERTVSASTDIVYSPNRLYIGLKKLADRDGNAEIECRLLTFDRNDLKGDDSLHADVRIRRLEWKYALIEENGVKKRQWREEVISEKKLKPIDVASKGTMLALKTLDYGHYQLQVGTSELDFYHWYGDGGSQRSSNPSVLTVSADAEKYVPGSVATLKFKGGNGAMLIAAGESRMEDVRAVDTVSGDNSVSLPIPAHVVGDAYFVELSLLTSGRNEDEDMLRSYALLRLPIDQSARKANLEIKAPEIAEPGKEIEVSLTANDANGRPLDGTVQLFAVDEGILSLTDYRTPDIFGFLHGRYYCDFQTYDIYSRIFPKEGMKAPSRIGGDGAFGGLRMEDIKNKGNAIVVLPEASIVDGRASLKFTVPRHLGAMRIMAVAACGVRVGSASRELKVRNKADVSATLPSIAAPGDSFHGMFKVINHEYDIEDAVLTVPSSNGISAGGDLVRKLKVKRGGSAVISLPFKVTGEGTQEISYSLEMGGTTVNGSAHINVRPAAPARTISDFVVLSPGQEYSPSTAQMSKVLDSRLSVASSVSIAACGALEWLNRYPYDCLEQSTSCAFPFLVTDKLLKSGLIDDALAATGKEKLETGVRRVLAMQRGKNGFASWIDSNEIWHEVSTYAAHLLILSNSPLFTASARENAEAFLLKRFDYADVEFQKAYNGYVLALYGNRGKANIMLQKLEDGRIGGMAQFMYAAALFKLGYARQALPALNDALDKMAWNDGNVGWYFSSDAMKRALALSIAMEIVPDNPANARLALELAKCARKDGSGWGMTSANAWVTYGLAHYGAFHKRQPAEIEVFAQGKSSRAKLEESQTIRGCDRILNHGPGDLFISASLRGVPKAPVSGGSITVHKEYRDADGNPVSKVKCGELITVQIDIRHNGKITNGVLLDLLPGGFEIENQALASRANVLLGENSGYEAQHIEMLEDRYLLFFKDKDGGCKASYNLRAVIPGKFKVPGASVDDMYNPDVNGAFASDAIIEIE